MVISRFVLKKLNIVKKKNVKYYSVPILITLIGAR